MTVIERHDVFVAGCAALSNVFLKRVFCFNWASVRAQPCPYNFTSLTTARIPCGPASCRFPPSVPTLVCDHQQHNVLLGTRFSRSRATGSHLYVMLGEMALWVRGFLEPFQHQEPSNSYRNNCKSHKAVLLTLRNPIPLCLSQIQVRLRPPSRTGSEEAGN